MIVRGVTRALTPVAAILLFACDDGSGTFALSDGCYHAANGVAVLEIRGSRGLIRSADSNLREVHVSPRVNQEGAYLEVSPGFYLRPPGMRAVVSGQQTTRFRIESRAGGQAILAPIEGAGEEELRLGAVCR